MASESGWARVPMSQTGPCVERHEPDFGRLYIYIYSSLAPEAESRGRLVRVWAPLDCAATGAGEPKKFWCQTTRFEIGSSMFHDSPIRFKQVNIIRLCYKPKRTPYAEANICDVVYYMTDFVKIWDRQFSLNIVTQIQFRAMLTYNNVCYT
jgi:hypothetical protein